MTLRDEAIERVAKAIARKVSREPDYDEWLGVAEFAVDEFVAMMPKRKPDPLYDGSEFGSGFRDGWNTHREAMMRRLGVEG